MRSPRWRRAEFHPPIPGPALKPEELEVLQLLVRGESDKRIAHQLGTSENVVHHLVANIREQFGAVNRTHVAALAVARGLRL